MLYRRETCEMVDTFCSKHHHTSLDAFCQRNFVTFSIPSLPIQYVPHFKTAALGQFKSNVSRSRTIATTNWLFRYVPEISSTQLNTTQL